jgi:hypothetical protein
VWWVSLMTGRVRISAEYRQPVDVARLAKLLIRQVRAQQITEESPVETDDRGAG